MAPTRRADPSQRIMAVSELIARMGVRVDPADVEEALRELPPGASVLDWYRQMTAKERARRSVVASVLMALHARALYGDVWDPPVRPARRSACARRLACSTGVHVGMRAPCRRTIVASVVEPAGLVGAGVASDGLTLSHGVGGRRADYARRSACSGP